MSDLKRWTALAALLCGFMGCSAGIKEGMPTDLPTARADPPPAEKPSSYRAQPVVNARL